MELADALTQNPNLFLDPYASSLSACVLTCLLARKLGGTDDGTDALQDQYRLREMAASLIGTIAKKYSGSIEHLRARLVRTCLKNLLDPTKTPGAWFGAINGASAAGGYETVRCLVLPSMKSFDTGILQPLREKGEASRVEYEALVGAIMKAVNTIATGIPPMPNGINGADASADTAALVEYLGPTIGERVAAMKNHTLNMAILEVKDLPKA